MTRYVISVSNKFLTWDLASSEICRDVDPHMEGLMLGLAVSPDYRQAVAHTSNNQVIVLDIILGQHRVLKNPLDPPDDILGMILNVVLSFEEDGRTHGQTDRQT